MLEAFFLCLEKGWATDDTDETRIFCLLRKPYGTGQSLWSVQKPDPTPLNP